jgi:hypothetical protein
MAAASLADGRAFCYTIPVDSATQLSIMHSAAGAHPAAGMPTASEAPVSRYRREPHPWLADHVIFFVYRWAAWAAGGAIIAARGGTPALMGSASLLFVTGGVNTLLTLIAQPYLRAAQRNPAILLLDIMYMVALLLLSGGWQSPFLLYASSALVVSGLLFGWRGGVMAGLVFVTLDLATNAFVGQPPDAIARDDGGLLLAAMMVAPPVVGGLFPLAVELLRAVFHPRPARPARPVALAEPRFGREPALDLADRLSPHGRAAERGQSRSAGFAPSAAHTATVRAPAQGVDDTRQVLFAPLLAESELPAAIDTLAERFRQHTGLQTRVVCMGRARMISRAQRSVLVRLTQESLLNVQQHAHAATIELTLRYDAASVALMIRDDGVGLLDGTYARPRLHALRAMEYRLAELGGRLDVFEAETGGLIVRATMPLD